MSQKRPRTEAELVEFVRAIDVRAPASLHASVQALVDASAERRPSLPQRARNAFVRAFGSVPRVAAATGALAVLALALVLALGGSGGTGGPSLPQTAALTTLPATAGAPAKSHTGRPELTAAVDGVAFPYWEDALGWRATGTRTDRIGGRTVTTVFYANHAGSQVGYAIVGGLPAPHVAGGQLTWRGATPYRVLQVNGATVVTWPRDGRMCVLAGRGVDPATLLHLAAWHDRVSV